jgi:hypothetical protein
MEKNYLKTFAGRFWLAALFMALLLALPRQGSNAYSQVTLWSEDFTLPDGSAGVSGKWSSTNSLTVKDGRLETSGSQAFILSFSTVDIPITGYYNVTLSMDVGRVGDMESKAEDPLNYDIIWTTVAIDGSKKGGTELEGDFLPETQQLVYDGFYGDKILLGVIFSCGQDELQWIDNIVITGIPCSVPPVFTTCPTDQTVTDNTSACKKAVSYAVDVTSDAPYSLTYEFTGKTTGSGAGTGSGSVFNIGVTNVKVTASGPCGTAACEFKVTVNDGDEPIPETGPTGTVTKQADPGKCFYTVKGDELDWTFWDCTYVTATNNINHTYTLDDWQIPVGEYEVIWTGTDAYANKYDAKFTLKVVDTQKPIFTCPVPLNPYNPDAGPGCTKNLNLSVTAAHDNCGIQSTLYFVGNEGIEFPYEFPVGTTNVKVVVSDIHGNSDECSYDVVVEPSLEVTGMTLKLSPNEAYPYLKAVGGNLSDGYLISCTDYDPELEYFYLDVDGITSTVPIDEGVLFPFYLDAVSLPDGFMEYWNAKGVNASAGSGTWQHSMYRIITGLDAIFYLINTSTDHQLIDGLQYNFSAGGLAKPFRISGDYPAGIYTVKGIVKDSYGCPADELEIKLELRPKPIIEHITLQAATCNEGEEPGPWIPFDGAYTDVISNPGDPVSDLEFCLDRDVEFFLLDVDELDVNIELMPGQLFPFLLRPASVPADFMAYWNAKGVNAGASPDTWQGIMWKIINGNLPMFYLMYDDETGDYKLIDALQYLYSDLLTPGEDNGLMNPFRISGNYPAGDYTVGGMVFSKYTCLSKPVEVGIKFNQKPKILTQPESALVCSGDPVTFKAETYGTGLEHQWYKNGTAISGANSATLTILEVTPADAGEYQLLVTGVCEPPVKSDVVSLSVTELKVVPFTQQYSDLVKYTATIYNAGAVTGYEQVLFKVGEDLAVYGPVDLVRDGDKLVGFTVEPVLLKPGMYDVRADFLDEGGLVTGCSPMDKLNVIPEMACANYIGARFVTTSGINDETAEVLLSVTVQEWQMGPFDRPGDITTAQVQFMRQTGLFSWEKIGDPVPVGLVDLSDPTVGTATMVWDYDLKGANSETEWIWAKVIGNYSNYYDMRCEAITLVTIAKPIGTEFITGGGYLILEQPSGIINADIGSKNNFGFNVKFNKKGTNLQGNINTIIRVTEGDVQHTFQVKGNALSSLSVKGTKAVFTGKANVQDMTDPLMPASMGGNYLLKVVMTDNGEPGTSDMISITVYDKNGGLWFTSRWETVLVGKQKIPQAMPVEQVIAGGNLVVHGSDKAGFISIGEDESSDVAPALTRLQVYPNPSAGQVSFRFCVEQDAMTTIDLLSSNGQLVQRAWEGYAESGVYETIEIDRPLAKGIYLVYLRTDKEVMTERLVVN